MQPVRKLLLLLPLLLLGASRSHAQTYNQSTFCNGSFQFSSTCTASFNVTAGSAYIVYFFSRAGTTHDTLSVSDNNGDTFVKVQDHGFTGFTQTIDLFYACNVSATPNVRPTYTATTNNNGSIWAAYFDEITGIKASCYDQSGFNYGSTGTHTVPWNGPTYTPNWSSTFFNFDNDRCVRGPFGAITVGF